MLATTLRAASRRGRTALTAGFASSSDVPPDAVSAAAHAVAASTSAPGGGHALMGARPIPAGAPPGTPASREIQVGAQAFQGDLRSASALGLGDGITAHTAKWLQADAPAAGVTLSPADLIAASPPIKVHGAVVASTGVDGDPALGCPVEYIDVSFNEGPSFSRSCSFSSILKRESEEVGRERLFSSSIQLTRVLSLSTLFPQLRGTSVDKPAVCKYTGLRYYSDDWAHAH